MGRINFGQIEKFHEDENDGFGIQWATGRDTPFMIIPQRDRDYWSYVYFIFVLIKKRWMLEIQLKKMPYRNKEQFLTWKRHKKLTLSA